MVLQAHRESGIKLNPKKTFLFRSKVEYFGYDVSTAGIKLIPSYIGKVVNWLQPAIGRYLVGFLGFTNYYHGFLTDFAKMTAGLNAVKSKKITKWNENSVHCFSAVKTLYNQFPCQASPDFSVHSKHLFLFIFFSGGKSLLWSCIIVQ